MAQVETRVNVAEERRNLQGDFALMMAVTLFGEFCVRHDIEPRFIIDIWRNKCCRHRQEQKAALADLEFPERIEDARPVGAIPCLALNDADFEELINDVAEELHGAVKASIKLIKSLPSKG